MSEFVRTWKHDVLRHRIDEAIANAHGKAAGEIRMAIHQYKRGDLGDCERWIDYAEWIICADPNDPCYPKTPVSYEAYLSTYDAAREAGQ